ncbi:protein kintoun [Culicoides brevitarsis]|uniref:protein kintoun n=1 Tax=Culicoides brevitarsis TaxID=469753 RepID=UPI00307C65AC
MTSESFEDLKITKDEFDRITEALKQEEFRKLFVEYCEEISDPENRKTYEAEIKQLESQRGVECQFVHPNPGFVVKTTNGEEKVFINIAKNDLVDRPTHENVSVDGKTGMNWSLPLIQAPVRKDMDKKNQWCSVYDVIFHPETLQIAERSSNFRQMVVQTALDAVCNAYKVSLDKTNLRFPRMEYKGMPKPTVIRKKKDDGATEEADMGPLKDIMPPLPEKKPKIVHKIPEKAVPEYTTPKYSIKYRKKLEMHEFTGQIDAKINSSVPSEMSLEIHLPLLRSATEAKLDVSRNCVSLCSEKPAKYHLEVKLSYDVDEKAGNACFNKEKRLLTITLPIIPRKIGVPEIEKTRKPAIEVLKETKNEEIDEKSDPEPIDEEPFFIPNTIYEVPDFKIVSYEGKMMKIWLETPNVSEVQDQIIEGQLFVKYKSLGEGFFPLNFGIVFNFDDSQVEKSTKTRVDGRLMLELELSKNVVDTKILYYGLPGVAEMNRTRIEDRFDPKFLENFKATEVFDENPVPQALEFESLKQMTLQK